MNPQLKLRKFFFEKVALKLPQFLTVDENAFIESKIGGYAEIYHHVRDINQFALRWKFETKSKNKSKSKRELFKLEVSIIGIFKFSKNSLTHSEKRKYLRLEAPSMLHEVVKKSLLPICKSSLIEGFRFPDLKSKHTSKK